jgi:peptide/nickel transport system ATP-binding protein
MTALLTIEDLRVDIPTASGMLHAVRGIDLAVERGKTLCIVGESGCGKSLTALALMSLLPSRAKRTAKRMRFGDIDLATISERDMTDLRGNRMAMVFQEPMTSLNPAYTIGNQLEEALLRHRKVPVSQARERAVHLLETVGITAAGERLRQYPHQLSGGLRQRVMIAMALMCGPDLLICDEPTTALDVTIQAQILHLLTSLQREFHMGMVLITHDLGIVARIADRVAVMYAGQVVETGTAREVFGKPLHPYTQGLLRCIPIPGKTKRGARLGAIPGIVPTPIGALNDCAFRNRCPHAFDECARHPIDLRTLSAGRSYRCLLDVGASAANAEKIPA